MARRKRMIRSKKVQSWMDENMPIVILLSFTAAIMILAALFWK